VFTATIVVLLAFGVGAVVALVVVNDQPAVILHAPTSSASSSTHHAAHRELPTIGPVASFPAAPRRR
jgi:hypothetical protein